MQAIMQRYVAWRAKVQQDGRSMMGHKLHDSQGRVVKGTGAASRSPMARTPKPAK